MTIDRIVDRPDRRNQIVSSDAIISNFRVSFSIKEVQQLISKYG